MAIEAIANQVIHARDCNDAGTFNNPPLTYSLHCASVKRKQQQEDNFKDKNGKKKNRGEVDRKADHGKQFGCLVLVYPNRAPNLCVNCPPLIRAGNHDGRPCYPFMTQGLTCTNRTTCMYLHVLDHLRGVEDRTLLLDWIAGKPALEWAPGRKVSWSLSEGGSRSTRGHCSAPLQRGDAAPPPPAQSRAKQQPAPARRGQQQRLTPLAPVTPAAAAPPASGNLPRVSFHWTFHPRLRFSLYFILIKTQSLGHVFQPTTVNPQGAAPAGPRPSSSLTQQVFQAHFGWNEASRPSVD
jgi:hypothetical protein